MSLRAIVGSTTTMSFLWDALQIEGSTSATFHQSSKWLVMHTSFKLPWHSKIRHFDNLKFSNQTIPSSLWRRDRRVVIGSWAKQITVCKEHFGSFGYCPPSIILEQCLWMFAYSLTYSSLAVSLLVDFWPHPTTLPYWCNWCCTGRSCFMTVVKNPLSLVRMPR